MTRHAVAYIRRSNPDEDDGAGEISRATQEDAVRQLAKRDGHEGELVWYADWGKSGRGDMISRRTDYGRMLEDVAAGRVSVMYAYALDRLNRDIEQHARLMRAVRDNRVRIVTHMEGEISEADPARWLMVTTFATQADYLSRMYRQRAKDAIRRRKARGDKVGGAPYGKKFAKVEGKVVLVDDPERPIQPILDAVRDASGNTAEAVRLLNERGVPSRYGRAWSPPALRGLLRKKRVMPPSSRRARRNRAGELRAPSPLSKLVRCPCGNTMTPVDSRQGLYCYIGSREGMARHGKYVVSQRAVWKAIETEADRIGSETKRTITHTFGDADALQRRAELEDELRRLGKAYRANAVDDREFDAESERLAAEIARVREDEVEAAEAATLRVRMTGPAVDLRLRDTDPVRLGEQLRRAFREIRLGPDLRPVEVVSRS